MKTSRRLGLAFAFMLFAVTLSETAQSLKVCRLVPQAFHIS